jgi:hypothetical protein
MPSKTKPKNNKALSLEDINSQIRQAFYDYTRTAVSDGAEARSSWVEATYADYLIVNEGDVFQKVPYSISTEGTVEIADRSEWREVERAWLVKTLKQRAKAATPGMLIHKQADGDYRWFGWVSNHYRDRDNPPEILSAKAHQTFVKWADKSKTYPDLWLWHVPGSKVGQADWLEFADGFLLASGLFDKDKTEVAERLAASKEKYTMSHGFERLLFDRKSTTTEAYWMFEMSILPEGPEANPWTNFTPAIKEGTMPISDKKKAFLMKFLPEETIKTIENDTQALKEAAEAAGADWKEVEALADEVTEPKKETPAATAATVDVKEFVETMRKELQLDSLSEMLSGIKEAVDTIPALKAKIEEQDATIKALQKSDDDKMADLMTPKAVKALSWFKDAHIASQADSTKLKEGDKKDEALKTARPNAFDQFMNDLVG